MGQTTVVVVDDTYEILELIEAVLLDEGYRVVLCQEPTRARERIVAEAPALVILDLRMAGVGEWEIVEQLRGDPRTAALPILMCSGAASELQAAEPRLRELGCEILVKPFDIDVLIEKAARLTGSAGPA